MHYEKQMNSMLGKTGPIGIDSMPNGVGFLGHSLLQRVNASKTQIESIETKLKDTIAFVQDFAGNSKGLMNCKLVRRSIIILSNTFCYDFGIAFAEQSH